MDNDNGSGERFSVRKIVSAVFFVLFLLVLLSFILFSADGIIAFIKGIINSLGSVLVGFVIAYLLLPLVRFFEKKVFYRADRKRKNSRLRRILSVSAVYILLSGLLAAFFLVTLPSVSDNFSVFAEKYGSTEKAFSSIESFLEDSFLSRYKNSIMSVIEDNKTSIIDWFYDYLIPGIENYALAFVGTLWTFMIGLIFSLFVCSNYERFVALTKKIVFSVLPEKNCNSLGRFASLIDLNFGKYLRGKIIDSVIVAVVSYIAYIVFGLKFAPILALIAGVTNMIPFFGPFIGAVPAGLIVLVAQPDKFITLCLIILILQQLDGNILDPMIVGGQVGLIPIFTMTSTLFFGGLFGIPGMLLGVPVFATFYTLADEMIISRLKKKNKPLSTSDYYS